MTQKQGMDIRGVGKLQFREYQTDYERTVNKPSLEHALLKLQEELGEVTSIYSKHTYQGHGLNTKDMALELGDMLFYITMAVNSLGYDLECVARMNMQKRKNRYPDGFNVERSINREQ